MVWVKADLPETVNRNLAVYAAENDLTKQEAAAQLIAQGLDADSSGEKAAQEA